jgi:hypothetical protein
VAPLKRRLEFTHYFAGLVALGLLGLLAFPYVAAVFERFPGFRLSAREAVLPWRRLETVFTGLAFLLGFAGLLRRGRRLGRGAPVTPSAFLLFAALPFVAASLLATLVFAREYGQLKLSEPGDVQRFLMFVLADATRVIGQGATLSGALYLLSAFIAGRFPSRRRERWTLLPLALGLLLTAVPVFAIWNSGLDTGIAATIVGLVGLWSLVSVLAAGGSANARVGRAFVVVASLAMVFPMFAAVRAAQLVECSAGPHGCGPASLNAIVHAVIAENYPDVEWLTHAWIPGALMLFALAAALLVGVARQSVPRHLVSVLVPALVVLAIGAQSMRSLARQLDDALPMLPAGGEEFVALEWVSWPSHRSAGPAVSIREAAPGPKLRQAIKAGMQSPEAAHVGSFHARHPDRATIAAVASLSGRDVKALLYELDRQGARELDWLTADREAAIEVTDDPRTWVQRLAGFQYATHTTLTPYWYQGVFNTVVGRDAARLVLTSVSRGEESVMVSDASPWAGGATAASVRVSRGWRSDLPVYVVIDVGDEATAESLLEAVTLLQRADFKVALLVP